MQSITLTLLHEVNMLWQSYNTQYQPLGTPHGHTPPHHLAGSATPIRPDSRASTIFSPAPPSSPAVFSIGKYQLLVHFEQRLTVT